MQKIRQAFDAILGITLTGIAMDSWISSKNTERNLIKKVEEQNKFLENHPLSPESENLRAKLELSLLRREQDLTNLRIKGENLQQLSEQRKVWEEKIKICNDSIINKNYQPGDNSAFLERSKEIYQQHIQDLNNTERLQIRELNEHLDQLKKQDSLGWLWDIIENFREYLSTLSQDQIVAVINLIGYFIILNTLIVICLILAGDKIIQRLNLEVKFPKIAILIKARAKFSKAYLTFQVFLLFALIFLYIGLNFIILFQIT